MAFSDLEESPLSYGALFFERQTRLGYVLNTKIIKFSINSNIRGMEKFEKIIFENFMNENAQK